MAGSPESAFLVLDTKKRDHCASSDYTSTFATAPFVLFFKPLSTILPFIRTTGKRIKATRLSEVCGIYRRTFLYGKKTARPRKNPAVSVKYSYGTNSFLKNLFRLFHKPLQALQAAAQKFDKFLILVQ